MLTRYFVLITCVLGSCSLVWASSPDSAATNINIAGELPKSALQPTNISFKDTDLRDVFRALSFQHNLNIFLDNSISKKTTISLASVRAIDALEFLCEQNDLALDYTDGIFKITPVPAPPAIPPPEKKIPILIENNQLSIEVKNDDLEKVVLQIQRVSGKNILVTSGTAGSLTGKLMDVEFDQGFTQLLNNNGFAVQKKNDIYIVSKLDNFVGVQGGGAKHPAGPYWVSVRDSLVSIDVTNAPLERLLADITRQLNADVVFYDDVSGKVTARASDVLLPHALDAILRNTNFTYRESEGIYFIGQKTNKALITTRLFKLKYLRADQLLEMIPQSITSQVTIKVMKEHNGIVAIASNDIMDQVREYLDNIDKPIPQVLIEALVVDYDISDGSDIGVTAGLGFAQDTTGFSRKGTISPDVDMQFNGVAVNHMLEHIGKLSLFGRTIDVGSIAHLPDDFYLRIRAMAKDGLANIRSRPLIATINGHQASLSIGTTQYYLLKSTVPYQNQNETRFQETETFQTIEADVKLELTPYVGVDGYVTVEIKPDFRTPVGQFSSEVPPTINTRSLSSTIMVRDGETIVIGGLISEGETETKTKVPLLGSIPLIGTLFSSTSKTTRKSELVIYITPHISYGEPFQQVMGATQ